jgi:beta-glucanase (GH16 family)
MFNSSASMHSSASRGTAGPVGRRAASTPALSPSESIGLCGCLLLVLAAASCTNGDDDWVTIEGNSPADASPDTFVAPAPDAGRHDVSVPPPVVEGGPAPVMEAATPDTSPGPSPTPIDASENGWTLTWSDEFSLPDGSPPDPNTWNRDLGGGGFGNKELEYYTDGAANAVVQGGVLVITAKNDGASQGSCWYGTCQYTSARLNTAGNFSQKYGRFEASIQVPSAQGMWPAFWMLGDNIGGSGGVGWPACGEIDILETVNVADSAHGSLHSKGYDATDSYTPPGVSDLSDGFHTYAVEWDAMSIAFSVDGHVYETHQSSDATNNGGGWPFDQNFFIILNLAVGGNWPGSPNGSTTFPQTMKVDWVRAYSKQP